MDAGDHPQSAAPMAQESVGASHSPEHSMHALSVNIRPQMEMAPRERNYAKLRKMGVVDFRATIDPMEAEQWLRATKQVFLLMECTPD